MERSIGPLTVYAHKHAPVGFTPRYIAGVEGRERRFRVMLE